MLLNDARVRSICLLIIMQHVSTLQLHVIVYAPHPCPDHLSLSTSMQEIVIKRKISDLSVDDVNPSRKSVEAALRYLVRSHEILEAAHGPTHPAVATGCLAVASVQNILEVRHIILIDVHEGSSSP